MPVTTSESLVPNLAAIRARRKMSQAQLARKVGVSTVMIANYESGRNNPSLKMMFNLALALDVSVTNLASLR